MLAISENVETQKDTPIKERPTNMQKIPIGILIIKRRVFVYLSIYNHHHNIIILSYFFLISIKFYNCSLYRYLFILNI